MTAPGSHALIDGRARLGPGASVGPFSVIGSDVELGAGCTVGPQCFVDGHATVGDGCVLTSHVALGGAPQDLKYAGEPTRLSIGARNTFREFVTVSRGTLGGGGLTQIGDDNLFMTGAHVAHDCKVGSHAVFANNATLAGHVVVGDHATMGAFTAVHQFCRVGEHAFVGGFTVVTQDVLPYMRTVGQRGDVRCYGPNRIGLQRKGVPAASIEALQRAFRMLRSAGGRTAEGVARIAAELGSVPEVALLVAFIESSRAARGFHL